jgi:hypothetical protein
MHPLSGRSKACVRGRGGMSYLSSALAVHRISGYDGMVIFWGSLQPLPRECWRGCGKRRLNWLKQD